MITFLTQLAHMASHELWSCGSTTFTPPLTILPHKQVVAKVVVLTFLFLNFQNLIC